MPINAILSNAKSAMGKAVDHLKEELTGIRTSKAAPALVENIMIEYYGSSTRLRDLAGISIPEPRQILIQPWDATAIAAIEKGIQKSSLGINPQSDGKTIRLVFPELTQERREELSKLAKKVAEESKIAVRNIRRESNDDLKKAEKSSTITEDERFKNEKKVQDFTDEHIHKIDELYKEKEKEIMTI